MQEEIEILLFKPFQRLRNKAQLFSGLAEDHFHTRMLHSFEVERIARMIGQKLIDNKIISQIDFKKLSFVALLHDIGHTPYGHIGERTLHKICSGQIELKGIENFKTIGCKCGFKHNINSAVLFIEELLKRKINIDENYVDIIEGIIKHSSLSYSSETNTELNYGFKYVNWKLVKEIPFSDDPGCIENIIVFFADEIAQIISDYRDLKNSKAKMSSLNKLAIFKPVLKNKNINRALMDITNNIVEILINDCKKSIDFNKLKTYNLAKRIKKFDEKREKIIKNYEPIKIHDSLKEQNIIQLYTYYFLHPKDGQELADEFIARAKRIYMPEELKDKVNKLTKTSLLYFINFTVIPKCKKLDDLSSREIKAYKELYSLYIWSVAIYVSKMTDNYADHKVFKISKTAL